MAGVFAVALVLSPVVSPTDSLMAQGWPPDSIKNLQVLPADISFGELVGTMRGFAIGLGVRCIHCHVGDDPSDLASTDFASDEKITKRKARVMLRMVQQINGEILAGLPERSDPAVEVTCATCHRGLPRPTTIEAVLAEQMETGGAEAAITEYERLREEYYGAGVYDFSEGALTSLARRTSRDHPDEALTVLEHNFKYFPESVATHVAKAQILANVKGDFEAAIASMRAAQELQPDEPRFQQMIDQMQAAMENQEE